MTVWRPDGPWRLNNPLPVWSCLWASWPNTNGANVRLNCPQEFCSAEATVRVEPLVFKLQAAEMLVGAELYACPSHVDLYGRAHDQE